MARGKVEPRDIIADVGFILGWCTIMFLLTLCGCKIVPLEGSAAAQAAEAAKVAKEIAQAVRDASRAVPGPVGYATEGIAGAIIIATGAYAAWQRSKRKQAENGGCPKPPPRPRSGPTK